MKKLFNQKTTALLHQLAASGIVPGVSYAMLHQGQLQAEVFGNKEIEPVVKPLTAGLKYDVASLTKVVGTTTVLLQLVQAQQINWDDPVQKYLPRFFDTRVTLRHLLTHTAAITGYIPRRNELSAPQLLEAFYHLQIGEWFGKKVVYTDIGLIFLGLIIEHLYQQPVQKVITEKVLQPLGLNESTFQPQATECVPTEIKPGRGLICGVVHDPKAFILGQQCASAGLFTTLHDLVKFSQWMLAKEQPHPLVSAKLIDQLFFDQTPTHTLGRSFGWDLRYDPQANACLYHTGYTGTFMLLDKKGQNALIVLTNRVHPHTPNDEFLRKRDEIVAAYLSEKGL
ncbi:beta-lactamase family protein [Liquorilactobacillus satsumensis]|uniref:serine hydrolase domain-containing protein n=1 Tax=Liquorilactobacillus satsumensis TaxID=259059 RepID=UPI0039ED2FBE|nr:beta-lactamase family protein [Liquorilactobacillus satsumensis]MCP9359598.1 beta-lactamase family protein [Liquorilactobacillus satsumensis]